MIRASGLKRFVASLCDWWLAGSNSSFQCRNGQPGIDRPADRIPNHAARPSIENGGHVDEADGDREK